jgi:hypothetical protein
MVFEEARLPPDLQDRSSRRRAILEPVFRAARAAFRSIEFGIFDNISAINAQACISNGVRRVNVCGGLAYHPAIRHDALAFVLLHETGHHLSSACRMRWFPELACDCAADHWAITEGRRILKKFGCSFVLRNALEQIGVATAAVGNDDDAPSQNSHCSSLNWSERKRQIIGGAIKPRRKCMVV